MVIIPSWVQIISGSYCATKAKIAEIDAILSIEPPVPELPPGQPLIKVSGVLEEIETQFVRGYFSDREYAPEEFARKEENRQWGSVLLAAIGESAAAAVHSQNEIRPVSGYDFVQGKINGIPFYGWVGLTSAKVGDYVEMAAINKTEHYEIYALTLPVLRVISIIPFCYQGIRSRAITETKGFFFIFPLIILSLLMIVGIFTDGMNLELLSATFGKVFCMIYGLFTPLTPFVYIFCINKPSPSTVLAQEIFSILGMTDPANINLKKITARELKKLRGNHSMHQVQDRLMPQQIIATESYYYY